MDDAAPDNAVSTVDFAPVAGHSLQPFRWNAAERTLSYQTELSNAPGLELRLKLPGELRAMAGTSFAFDASSGVLLGALQPRGQDQLWGSSVGTARLTLVEEGRLRLELSGLVFANGLGEPLLSTDSGSIVGAWVEVP